MSADPAATSPAAIEDRFGALPAALIAVACVRHKYPRADGPTPSEQRLVTRARILLRSAEGAAIEHVARTHLHGIRGH